MNRALPLFLVSLLSMNLSMCKKEEKTYIFDDYLTTFDNIFNFKHERYYIFFYLEYCLSCKYIFEKIEYQKVYLKQNIYYVDLKSLPNENLDAQKDNIGVDSYIDIHLNSAPTFLLIENQSVIKQLDNLKEIEDELCIDDTF